MVVRRAQESLKVYGLAEREQYHRVLSVAQFGEPVLVQRLDLPDTFYYIVPVGKSGSIPLAIAIDAKTGLYMQSAIHSNLEGNLFTLKPREEVAKSIMGSTVELPNWAGRIPVRQGSVCVFPTYVWKPCRESLSPFFPFHMFTIGSQHIYVRSDGAIFTALHDTDPGI
jgi:hypothetical protein